MHVKFSLTLHYVLHLTTWIKKNVSFTYKYLEYVSTHKAYIWLWADLLSQWQQLQQFLKVGALISSCFLYNQVLISRKPNIWWYFLPFLLFLQNKNKKSNHKIIWLKMIYARLQKFTYCGIIFICGGSMFWVTKNFPGS